MPSVRVISPSEHREYLDSLPAASFLQTPGWAAVKSEWRAESLGWFRGSQARTSTQGFEGDELVGAALVLHRRLPKLNKTLAYLPEGPVIDWSSDGLGDWLDPMVAHLKQQGAFAVRIGPPVITRRWDAAQVKAGIADESIGTLGEIAPTERSATGARVLSQLRDLGWRHQGAGGGFAAGQPQYNFHIPLVSKATSFRPADARTSTGGTTADARTSTDEAPTPRTEDDVLKGMNQLWRRNIKRAAKEGVEVRAATAATIEVDLEAFHELYVHTAERDGFTPRPLSYFATMADALNGDAEGRFQLWLAEHEGDLVAATISVRVGQHAWYSYGASSTEKRNVRGSNAVQWAMIRDALEHGAHVYDLRGITDTLDPDNATAGLIQFKVGTGGEAVEYAGEWDLPINRALYKAFQIYLSRR